MMPPKFYPSMIGHVVTIKVKENGDWGSELSIEAGVLRTYMIDVKSGLAGWVLDGAEQSSQRPYRLVEITVQQETQ